MIAITTNNSMSVNPGQGETERIFVSVSKAPQSR
jgi:hypothetical protein